MTATALEERLQELRHTIRVPSLPDVDELAGRATRRRRGRRRRVAVAAGALAVVVLLPAVIVARHGDDPDVRVRTGAPGQPGPPATTPLPVSGIPIDLFESNPCDGSIIVNDLDAGVRATYADGEHTLDFGAPHSDFDAGDEEACSLAEEMMGGVLSAALTADGALIAGVMPAQMHGPLVVFAPGQPLSEPGRQLRATADWQDFRPTERGDGLWVITDAGDLVLVDLATGDVRQSLAGAAGDNPTSSASSARTSFFPTAGATRARCAWSRRRARPPCSHRLLRSILPTRHRSSSPTRPGPCGSSTTRNGRSAGGAHSAAKPC
jgi:hypothetical protein